MPKIEFTVLGNPKALKRHRTFRRGNFVGQYDPSVKEKDDFLVLAHQHAPPQPIDVPVKLRVEFLFARPKSHYRKGILKQDAPITHIGRPDIDNLIKFIMDSLNGVYWKDDSIIYDIVSSKYYDEIPRTDVIIIY